MIVDSMTKTSLELGQSKRTSSSLKRIYNQLRQTYYQQLFFHNQTEQQPNHIRKKTKEEKDMKKTQKILPGILSRQQTLNAREIEKFLTYKQIPVKRADNSQAEIINYGCKLTNRQLKDILFPNRMNNLKLSRYLSKRKSYEPSVRDPEDIIITKKLQIVPTQRALTRGSAIEATSTPKKKSLLSPIKQIIRKSNAKCSQIELPPLINFEDFILLMKEYHYFRIKQQIPQYKAYIGKGNNSCLVKRLLKDRGYWVFVDKYAQDVHFVWSQTKNNNLLKSLKKRQLAVKNSNTNIENSKRNQDCKIKNESCGITKIMTKDMTSNILKSYKGSKKIGFITLVSQIKSQRKNIDHEDFDSSGILFHNHVQNASSIGNKKGLLYHMSQYYKSIERNPFQIVPESIHLVQKPTIHELKNKISFGIPCILKPASGTNRGNGITIHTTWSSLHSAIQQSPASKSFVVQRYLSPFLYKNRKFDIRVWILWFNGQAWWYSQGYIRTSSKEFSLKTCNRFVHLTNDAVQKKSQDYGKYESGNKLSFADFQKYLMETHSPYSFADAYQQMKDIAKDVFRVASPLMDPNRKSFGYELFGLDFMIDENFKVWLIEANTNPCLQTSCSLLNRLISNMLEGVLNLTLDVVFEPPQRKRVKRDWNIDNFRFQLLYDHNQVWNEKKQIDATKFETDEDQFQEVDEQ